MERRGKAMGMSRNALRDVRARLNGGVAEALLPEWQGPMRAIVVPCGDWTVRAEQHRLSDGSPGAYDVYCEHVSGARVPPGPNMHRDPGAELARLQRLL